MSPLRELYGGMFLRDPGVNPRLAVVLPALNEEATVADAVKQISEALADYNLIDIIVVDDGSVDETCARAERAGARVISHRGNEGLGVALATGVDVAIRLDADIIVTMDADGQFSGRDVPDLIRLLIEGKADIVVGSRYLRPDYVPAGTSWAKRTASALMAWMVSQIAWGKKLTDVTCGFRAYTRDAAIRLSFLSRFTYTVESIIDAYYKGLHLTEVPIRVRGRREHGKSRMTANFPLYAFGLFVILMRRMRDVRPLMFFSLFALFWVFFGGVAVGGVAWLWPVAESRGAATAFVGIEVMILAVLLAVALVADQIHTITRYVHSIVRMQRIQYYDNPGLFGNRHRREMDRAIESLSRERPDAVGRQRRRTVEEPAHAVSRPVEE